MPYINQARRDELNSLTNFNWPKTAGELNFLFTQALIYSESKHVLDTALTTFATSYLLQKDDMSYQLINDIMGAALCAGAEWSARTGKPHGWRTDCIKEFLVWFYQDIGHPYEQEKREKNGDVYPVSLGGTAPEAWPKDSTKEERDYVRDLLSGDAFTIIDMDLPVGQAPGRQYGPETA